MNVRNVRYYSLCMLLLPLILQANTCDISRTWRTFAGGQGGFAVVTNAGQSVLFPIETSDSDEFYAYTVTKAIKVPSLYGGFVGAQWKSQEHDWGMSLSANYSQTSSFSVAGVLTQGISPTSSSNYDYSFDMRARQFIGQVQFQYFGKAHFIPYVVAGLGAAFNQSDNFTTTVDPTLSLTRMYANNNSLAGCTYVLGLGFDVHRCDRFRIGAGYKFSDFGKFALGQASIDGTAVSGTISQKNMYANEFILQLTMLF